MGTDRQNEANRENAKRSTGPKSGTGKAAVAKNAVQHGIFCNTPVLATERRVEWERFRVGVIESLHASGPLEVTLAERAALLLWRMGRLARFEVLVTAAAIDRIDVPPEPSVFDMPDFGRVPTNDPAVIAQREARAAQGRAWAKEALLMPGDDQERKITRYESHLSRQLQITLLQLRMLQAGRSDSSTTAVTTGTVTENEARTPKHVTSKPPP